MTTSYKLDDHLRDFSESLQKKNAQELRKEADSLLEGGIPLTSINFVASEYFGMYMHTRPKRVRRIADNFADEPYHWDAWLIKEGQTIKGKSGERRYV